MLGKLIKHEFRAYCKTTVPIFLCMAALSLFTRFVAFPLLTESDFFLINAIGILSIMVFFISMAGMALLPLILAACRFKTGVLGNEGYLTMTLPVSSHEILLGKLINNIFWCILDVIFLGVIFWIMVTDTEDMFMHMPGFVRDIAGIFSGLDGVKFGNVFNYIVLVLEVLLNMILACTMATLVVFCAYSIGYSANKHKSLWTVLLIYGFYQLLSVTCMAGVFLASILFDESFIQFTANLTGAHIWQFILFCCILFQLAISAIFYVITNHFITKRLNLE